MEPFSYNSLFTGPTVWFEQSTENWSTERLIRVWCRNLSSYIHNIGYILLKQTPLKTFETLKEKFAAVSLKTKKISTVMKVVRYEPIWRVFCSFGKIALSKIQC